MTTYLQRWCLLMLIVGLPLQSFAQFNLFSSNRSAYRNPYTAVSIGGGSSHYIGDLVAMRRIYYIANTNVRWNATVNYLRYLSPRVGVRASYSYVRLFGSDFNFGQRDLAYAPMAQNFIRNLHFRNDLQEFVVAGVFNLRYDDETNPRKRKQFMPYAVAGIGLVGHNPTAKAPANALGQVEKQFVSLKEKNTSGQTLPGGPKVYSSIAAVVPIALGARWHLNQRWAVNFEAGYRMAFTDYLDDVGSTVYPDLNNPAVDGAFSYRAAEALDAVSGKSRETLFGQATLAIPNGSAAFTPSNAPTFYNPLTENRGQRGDKLRFYHRFDQYITTQLTLSYTINSNGSLKCPTIQY